jgi:3,4-dihydroxy 2-butanone 4-phosphate synthase/GTP cyclohydrolase II
MAGLFPAAVICEILKDDGSMARLPDLAVFAKQHSLKIGAIADLIHYRAQTERLVERIGKRRVRTARGPFEMIVFRDKLTDATHLALVNGQISPENETLVRVHEPLSAIDILDVDARSHSWSIDAALATLQSAQRGVMVLLHRTESARDLRRRALSVDPPRSAKVDLRTYGIGSQILRDLGVGKMRLLAQPRKMPSMSGFDLEITGFMSAGRSGFGLAKLEAETLSDIVAYSARIPVKTDRKS